MVPFLSTEFTKAYNMFRTTLTGAASNKTREEICFKYTDEILGPLVGALFIRHAFSVNDKQEAEEMMRLIINAFEDNVSKVPWISQQTIKSVREKASIICKELWSGLPSTPYQPITYLPLSFHVLMQVWTRASNRAY